MTAELFQEEWPPAKQLRGTGSRGVDAVFVAGRTKAKMESGSIDGDFCLGMRESVI